MRLLFGTRLREVRVSQTEEKFPSDALMALYRPLGPGKGILDLELETVKMICVPGTNISIHLIVFSTGR